MEGWDEFERQGCLSIFVRLQYGVLKNDRPEGSNSE
jgi:hypothetical protein